MVTITLEDTLQIKLDQIAQSTGKSLDERITP